jgi:phage terminase small subunit
MTAGTTIWKLTPKEEAFCVAIVAGFNQSDAYRKAYSVRRSTPKTINEKASRLMAKGKIRARVAVLMQPLVAGAQMKRREWLELMTRLARFDPRKMFDEGGRLKEITELEIAEAQAIQAFERIEQYDDAGDIKRAGHRVRYISRLEALALLGKALGYYADQCGTKGLEVQTLAPSAAINIVPVSVTPDEAYRQIVSGTKT